MADYRELDRRMIDDWTAKDPPQKATLITFMDPRGIMGSVKISGEKPSEADIERAISDYLKKYAQAKVLEVGR